MIRRGHNITKHGEHESGGLGVEGRVPEGMTHFLRISRDGIAFGILALALFLNVEAKVLKENHL